MSEQLTQQQTETIADALAGGRKIEAIKLYREYSGNGLTEAKDFVEALEPELRKKDPARFAHAKAEGKGCAAMLVVWIAVVILAVL